MALFGEMRGVRGVFPRIGSLQFIDGQRVDDAVARPLTEDPTAALIWVSI
jgi:hypothetical protein